MKFLIVFLGIFAFNLTAMADEGPFLDPHYGEHEPLTIEKEPTLPSGTLPDDAQEALKISPLVTALAQTPVKSQMSRGTCSIFSATAVLEFKMKQLGLVANDPDLSEQWLEYITAGQRGREGSWSYYNFDQYGQYGFLDESDWGYHGTSWHPYKEDYWDFTATVVEKELFKLHCEPLKSTPHLFDGCLIGQANPQFLNLDDATLLEKDAVFFERRELAAENLEAAGLRISSKSEWSNLEVQKALDAGDVVSLDIDFFYEAWNHRRGSELGLQRDMDLWNQGVVTFPDRNSKDYKESQRSDFRAGHSIVLVGYDKNIVLERQVEDQNGNMMTVKTQGVYYFKNSWGQEGFGRDFELQGESLPGFGMISMDYAHRDGRFYRMVISKR